MPSISLEMEAFYLAQGINAMIDQGDPQINEEKLRKVHLPPFKKAIDEGV